MAGGMGMAAARGEAEAARVLMGSCSDEYDVDRTDQQISWQTSAQATSATQSNAVPIVCRLGRLRKRGPASPRCGRRRHRYHAAHFTGGSEKTWPAISRSP